MRLRAPYPHRLALHLWRQMALPAKWSNVLTSPQRAWLSLRTAHLSGQMVGTVHPRGIEHDMKPLYARVSEKELLKLALKSYFGASTSYRP